MKCPFTRIHRTCRRSALWLFERDRQRLSCQPGHRSDYARARVDERNQRPPLGIDPNAAADPNARMNPSIVDAAYTNSDRNAATLVGAINAAQVTGLAHVQPVPEPDSLALVGLGVMVLMLNRRRRGQTGQK